MIQIKENPEKLEILLPQYNVTFVALMRKIEGRRYYPSSKTWEIPATHKEQLINMLTENKLSFNIVTEFQHKEVDVAILKYNDCVHLRFHTVHEPIIELLRNTEGAQNIAPYNLWRINLQQLVPLIILMKRHNITFSMKQRNINVISILAELRYLIDQF